MKGRPNFPSSFFDRIFEYHSEHNGSFDRVHDAGAGGGVHSAQLATRFSHVVVSDAGGENVETAKSKLGTGSDKFSFRVAKVEDADDLAPASVDMIFLACVLHLTDLPKAFAAIAHQLKPGGTLVVVMASIAFFQDVKVQDAYRTLYSTGSGRMMESATAQGAQLSGPAEMGFSAYNSVAIPEAIFEAGVKRIKLNWPGHQAWHSMGVPPHLDDTYPYVSRISPHDHQLEERDGTWNFQASISEIADFYGSVPFPSLTEDKEMAKLWQDMQAVVGEGKVDGVWPVTLILATKK